MRVSAATPGITPIAIGRSLVSLPFRRSGASTLTQQITRRLYLQGAAMPVVERQAREALIALQRGAPLQGRHAPPQRGLLRPRRLRR